MVQWFRARGLGVLVVQWLRAKGLGVRFRASGFKVEALALGYRTTMHLI